MKHLKIFESFSLKSNALVNYINYDNFENLLSFEKIDEITDGEVEKIKHLIEIKLTITKYEKLKRFRFDKIESVASFEVNFDRNIGRGQILFYKFQDGWWMVELCLYGKNSNFKPKYTSWILDDFDGINEWVSVTLNAAGYT